MSTKAVLFDLDGVLARKPAIVLVDGTEARLIRTRETFDDMLARDILCTEAIP